MLQFRNRNIKIVTVNKESDMRNSRQVVVIAYMGLEKYHHNYG